MTRPRSSGHCWPTSTQVPLSDAAHNILLFAPATSSKVQVISYRDAVYQGETVRGKKHGLGIAQKFQGLCYFGEWKDDLMHGDGMMILPVGYLLRGKFFEGKLHGNLVISTPVNSTDQDKSMYLQSFHRGVLTGANTILTKDNLIQILRYKDGKCLGVVKEKLMNEPGDSNIRTDIYDNLFPLSKDVVNRISKASLEISSSDKLLSSKPESKTLIGNFVLEDGLFFGVVKDGLPDGLGVFIASNGNIKIGCSTQGQFEGPCRVIDPLGSIMDGVCRGGALVDKCSSR